MKPEFEKNAFYALYPYGSRIYGTAQKHSDWDYIAVDDNFATGEMSRGSANIKFMNLQHFQKLLDEHHIIALECFFLPEDKVEIKPAKPWKFKLDRVKLRHSFMEKASKDWVKAKKKFISPYDKVQNELYRGKKSLFHAFRILSYGIQISKFGKIIAYNEMNDVYLKIMTNTSTIWEDYEKDWKPFFNTLSSDFRKVAPK